MARKTLTPYWVGCAELLIRYGVDVHHPDSLGNTPLHYAVTKVSPLLTQKLIEAGADMYTPNKKGVKPIDLTLGFTKDRRKQLFDYLGTADDDIAIWNSLEK